MKNTFGKSNVSRRNREILSIYWSPFQVQNLALQCDKFISSLRSFPYCLIAQIPQNRHAAIHCEALNAQYLPMLTKQEDTAQSIPFHYTDS